MEQTTLRGVSETTGRIFRIRDYKEASRNFHFNFIRKKVANIMKTKSAQTKWIDMNFKDLKKNIYLVTLVLVGEGASD